ncbi:MAG: prephenate dehydrogenase/arogenate dehydrogenase family protein [Firmicutes bacterium]|nr:prephenate dehydrogenase/arogenate dehydrogenase family protein [Bacillota bacterium]
MDKIGILGFGLIGGSIAKALKGKADVVAYSRSEQPLKDGYTDGCISAYSNTSLDVFKGCKYVFLCTPVDMIPDYAQKLVGIVGKDCIFTDVGSTKGEIFHRMNELDGIKFIAGHPMAGSEKTGYSAASAHLYENAYYIIAPNKNVAQAELDDFTALVRSIGALPLYIEPEHHDFVVAAISHVPHIIASALVNTVRRLDSDKLMHTVAAGGFKDITRIASSSAEVWSSICFENREEILKVTDSFVEVLQNYRNDIENSDYNGLFSRFENAKNYRDSFAPKRSTDNYHSLLVDVEDVPGIIASIATLLSENGISIKNIGIINSREYADGVLQIVFSSGEYLEKSAALLEDAGYKLYK